MKIIISNNSKSYTFLKKYKALQKESKQKQNKQTNKQATTQPKSKR
jgi:hypothetical protein